MLLVRVAKLSFWHHLIPIALTIAKVLTTYVLPLNKTKVVHVRQRKIITLAIQISNSRQTCSARVNIRQVILLLNRHLVRKWKNTNNFDQFHQWVMAKIYCAEWITVIPEGGPKIIIHKKHEKRCGEFGWWQKLPGNILCFWQGNSDIINRKCGRFELRSPSEHFCNYKG